MTFELRAGLHMALEILAFTLAYQLFRWQRKRSPDNLVGDQRLQVLVFTALGALLGSRLLGALENPAEWWASEHFWLYLYSNKTVAGGFLGGLIGAELSKKVLGIKRSSGDLLVEPILLGLVIGRIGCWIGGVADNTHGLPTDLPWAMDLGDGIPRHPAQLYEILFCLGLWLLIRRLGQRRQFAEGAKFRLFLAAYLTWRLLADVWKPHVAVLGPLGSIQIASFLGMLYYWKVFLRPSSLFRAAPPSECPTDPTPTTTSP